ncbi:MAG: hypothetical protein S4CHLAM20_08190 [Chlamydiia bacterium]|nr:hypothetical protein [Chlamydiia bacterium]
MKPVSKEVKAKHEKMIWTVFACSFLGFWLIFSHFAFGYKTIAMSWNDSMTGIFVMFCAFFARKPNKLGFFAIWLICFAGIWLNFAPLLFWAKSAVEYLNDTIIGILLILFSLIIPGLPGKVTEAGHEIPPGWSYNPSAWIQRIPVIKLGMLGMFISRYLAGYQLGYFDYVWNPEFLQGTKEVLTSNVASFFPVSDAGLGCFAYTLEVLLGLKGGENRWRTMPWMVISFVLLVVPLGIVSIILVILQPLLVGHWCFLCLCTATAMMIMIVYAVDELIAVFQFLHLTRKAKKSVWQTFWHGGDLPGTKDEEEYSLSEGKILELEKKARLGVGYSWNLFLSAIIGIVFMLTPYWFSIDGLMADMDHLFGALIIVISILSLAEVIRALRFVNILFGAALITLSWVYYEMPIFQNIFAIALILLSFRRGKIKETYGPWQKMIK